MLLGVIVTIIIFWVEEKKKVVKNMCVCAVDWPGGKKKERFGVRGPLLERVPVHGPLLERSST